MAYSAKIKDKLEELKGVVQYTGINRQDSRIHLIRDGYVAATLLLDEKRNLFGQFVIISW